MGDLFQIFIKIILNTIFVSVHCDRVVGAESVYMT